MTKIADDLAVDGANAHGVEPHAPVSRHFGRFQRVHASGALPVC